MSRPGGVPESVRAPSELVVPFRVASGVRGPARAARYAARVPHAARWSVHSRAAENHEKLSASRVRSDCWRCARGSTTPTRQLLSRRNIRQLDLGVSSTPGNSNQLAINETLECVRRASMQVGALQPLGRLKLASPRRVLSGQLANNWALRTANHVLRCKKYPSRHKLRADQTSGSCEAQAEVEDPFASTKQLV